MRFFHVLLMTLCVWLASGNALAAPAAGAFGGDEPHIAAQLDAETVRPAPGSLIKIAFVMEPEQGWHGYWSNPGDAGLGLTAKWQLPEGVTVGAMDYPVPQRLIIAGLMNYVYEGPYAILMDAQIPADARPGDVLPLRVKATWLACTEQICVPENAELALTLTVGDGQIDAKDRARFDGYRAALPRPLDQAGSYAIAGDMLRIAIPFPQGAKVSDPYFYSLTQGVIKYAAGQNISRNGDRLIVEVPAAGKPAGSIEGIIQTASGQGLMIRAAPGTVPAAGAPAGTQENPAQPWSFAAIAVAVAGAILGGLLLNVMPCVFPILSLKAISLARAGESEHMARMEALAYAAGVMLVCAGLGAILLVLRAGGSAAGWAFQLQNPHIILLLLILMTAVSLNLAGLFELRGFGGNSGLAGKPGLTGAFWTGALAAFVATPCAGPFMGTALGAALVLPAWAAMAVFAALGLGIALPFMAIAFIPALRKRMPKPGPWMQRMRHILSLPMFATALALAWLIGRQAGVGAMTLGMGAALAAGIVLWWLGDRQRAGKNGGWIALALRSEEHTSELQSH